MGMTQPFLPLSDDSARQRVLLRQTRNAAFDLSKLSGKCLEVFEAISRASQGLTMAEMAAISGRGINCWTQPFTTLREAGVIEATDEIRNRGRVHRLVTTTTEMEWE